MAWWRSEWASAYAVAGYFLAALNFALRVVTALAGLLLQLWSNRRRRLATPTLETIASGAEQANPIDR